MRLKSIAAVTPPHYHTQKEWGEAMQRYFGETNAPRQTRLMVASCAATQSVEGRYFSVESLDELIRQSPDEMVDTNTKASVVLATLALWQALEKEKIPVRSVDALITTTSTGFLCPGLSSRVAGGIGFRKDTFYLDITGMGCSAALIAWRAAEALLHAGCETVACVSSEVCSSMLDPRGGPTHMILSSLFGDSASATVWTREESGIVCGEFTSLTLPEKLRDVQVVLKGGRFIPHVAPDLSESVKEMLSGVDGTCFGRVISHAGGTDILQHLKDTFPNLAGEVGEIFRTHGNLGSNSVVFALERALANGPLEDPGWLLAAFGGGLNATTCTLKNAGR